MSFPKQLDELKPLRQWVAYRLVWNAKKGKADKRPINPYDGTGAKANDPATWGTYDEAMKYALKNGLVGNVGGVGFEFGNGYAGIDLDDVVEAGGTLKGFALEIVELISSYAEGLSSKLCMIFFPMLLWEICPYISHKSDLMPSTSCLSASSTSLRRWPPLSIPFSARSHRFLVSASS